MKNRLHPPPHPRRDPPDGRPRQRYCVFGGRRLRDKLRGSDVPQNQDRLRYGAMVVQQQRSPKFFRLKKKPHINDNNEEDKEAIVFKMQPYSYVNSRVF